MPAKWQQWMPLYIDRFLGSVDVQTMEPAAFKGYLCLLLAAWQTEDCTVAADDAELAKQSRLGRKVWMKHKPDILPKFETVTVTVSGALSYRLRNGVEYELWQEAKRVFEARQGAAKQTNSARSPKRSPSTVAERSPSRSAHTRTITGTETETETGEIPSPPLDLVPVNPEPLEALPLDADPVANIPDGLAPTQYAHFVLTEVAVPANYGLRVKTGDAIEMLAKLESCGMAAATVRMLDRMRAAYAEGERKWSFWLEDGGWKSDAGRPVGGSAAARDAFLAEVEA